MSSRAGPAPQSEPDEPHEEKDDGDDPQQVYCESQSEDDQYEEECQEENHGIAYPFGFVEGVKPRLG